MVVQSDLLYCIVISPWSTYSLLQSVENNNTQRVLLATTRQSGVRIINFSAVHQCQNKYQTPINKGYYTHKAHNKE